MNSVWQRTSAVFVKFCSKTHVWYHLAERCARDVSVIVLYKFPGGIRLNQRFNSQPRLSLLITHELSLAVRLFSGPSTAIELGTSWEARYLNKKHMLSQRIKDSQSGNGTKHKILTCVPREWCHPWSRWTAGLDWFDACHLSHLDWSTACHGCSGILVCQPTRR